MPAGDGPAGLSPGLLLKIYVYGYINQIASSRRLEREAQRNVEMMWLTGRLAPDFKTIADFRKDNGPAIRGAAAQFVELCRRLELFTHGGGGDRRQQVQGGEHPRQELHRRQAASSGWSRWRPASTRYMAALETADRQEGELAQAKSVRLKDKIAALREQMQRSRRWSRGAGRAGPAGLADRSGRALDGDQRPGHAAWSATTCRPPSMPSIT